MTKKDHNMTLTFSIHFDVLQCKHEISVLRKSLYSFFTLHRGLLFLFANSSFQCCFFYCSISSLFYPLLWSHLSYKLALVSTLHNTMLCPFLAIHNLVRGVHLLLRWALRKELKKWGSAVLDCFSTIKILWARTFSLMCLIVMLRIQVFTAN